MDRILLCHLSDLHFGSGFEGATTQHVGLGGHEIKLTDPLRLALKHARCNDFQTSAADKIAYFIGGDLTRTGSNHDFQLVYTYLFAQLDWHTDRSGNTDSAGLALPVWDTYSIPGNHDHWNGQSTVGAPPNRPPSYNASIFPHLQEPTPWRHSIRSPNGQFILELFGVDSNEGLRNKATNLRAQGSLSDEELYGVRNGGIIVKKGLQQLLEDAKKAEEADKIPRLRAVCCHHAFGNKYGLLDAWPLDSTSIAKLLQLCRQFKVHAVLTGHTHYFLNWRQPDHGTGWHVWELRCGSTLQREMATPTTSCTQPQPQGFLIHELTVAANGKPSWTVWKYQYGLNRTGHWAFHRDPNKEVIH